MAYHKDKYNTTFFQNIEDKKESPSIKGLSSCSSESGNRTRVSTVRGWRARQLH